MTLKTSTTAFATYHRRLDLYKPISHTLSGPLDAHVMRVAQKNAYVLLPHFPLHNQITQPILKMKFKQINLLRHLFLSIDLHCSHFENMKPLPGDPQPVFKQTKALSVGDFFLCDCIGNTVDLCIKTNKWYKNKAGRAVQCKVIETLISDARATLGSPVNGEWSIPYEYLFANMITLEQAELIGHSLGINVYGCYKSKRAKDKKLPSKFYRNYYASSKNSDANKIISSLIILDFIVQGQNWNFHVTELGIEIFTEWFNRNINKTGLYEK